ncbi:MAG: hypothetical protein ACE5FA_06250 [Dehalococcoidia bacterium]
MRLTTWFKLARHYIWLAPVVLGIVFVAAGVYMVTEGQSAKDEVRDAIIAENIITSEDASIPNVLVNSAATAKAEADVIEMHYLNITGGKTYAELDREDPLRATALTAANLRTSLNLAVMGFKVSDLVIGMGAFMILIGGTFVVFIGPAVYYSAEVANHYDQLMKEKKEKKVSGTAQQQPV